MDLPPRDAPLKPNVHLVVDQLWNNRKGDRWVALYFPGSAWSGDVWLRLEVRDGYTVATGLLIDSPEALTSRDLREVRLGELLRVAATANPSYENPVARCFVLPRELPIVRRPGPKGHQPDELRQVAAAYREACKTHPTQPMKRTSEVIGYSLASRRRRRRSRRSTSSRRTCGLPAP